VDWVADFYTKQYEWAGWPRRWAEKDVGEAVALAATHVEAITRLAGPGEKRILELGAGSGFTSAALADAGHDVVAVDLVDTCVESIGRLAGQVENGSLRVVAGDFYSVDLEGRFDVILLFDGFGIGTDDDQRRLLRRMESWLSPQGSALIDVFAPVVLGEARGHGRRVPGRKRRLLRGGVRPRRLQDGRAHVAR
jgi:SAM-dependent methyltransferase